MPHHAFLEALTIVLCTAGITTVIFQRLRQPVILGYILAGVIVGPHVPIPLIANPEIVQTLSEAGVILLMFSLGLEFRLQKLFQMGPGPSITAMIECSVMVWLGFLVGKMFGWSAHECLFAGAIIAISSTTIIVKAFDEQGIRGRVRELVIGVLVAEDLIAVLLMTALTALSAGGGMGIATLARSSARLLGFLIGFGAVGLLIVPPTMRAVQRLQRAETTLVASIGVCFAGALLALEFGYSVALGAFIAGSLVAESGAEAAIEPLIHPVRDMFAAIFFVSVGMLIDPQLIVEHWQAVAVLTFAVIGGKVLAVGVGSFLTGNGIRMSMHAGMSLAQIGEFSFIIATLGTALGATRPFLYPVAVAVSALTTLTTPWLIRASGPAASFVDRKLPRALQTFAALYGSWIEGLHTATQRRGETSAIRRLARLLAVDLIALAALVVGAALCAGDILNVLQGPLGLSVPASKVILVAGVGVLAIPLVAGLFRITRRLGETLAEATLPHRREGKADLAEAPRRAFVVTLQLAITLLIGLPILAVAQPFVSVLQGTLALVVLLAILGIAFWRSATNLQGHVKAGAAMIVEALTSQARKSSSDPTGEALARLAPFLPGLGEPAMIRLEPDHAAVGSTLAQLNVRGLTGATVLAITRGDVGVVPTAREVLQAGDILALAGTREAVQAAIAMLRGVEPAPA